MSWDERTLAPCPRGKHGWAGCSARAARTASFDRVTLVKRDELTGRDLRKGVAPSAACPCLTRRQASKSRLRFLGRCELVAIAVDLTRRCVSGSSTAAGSYVRTASLEAHRRSAAIRERNVRDRCSPSPSDIAAMPTSRCARISGRGDRFSSREKRYARPAAGRSKRSPARHALEEVARLGWGFDRSETMVRSSFVYAPALRANRAAILMIESARPLRGRRQASGAACRGDPATTAADYARITARRSCRRSIAAHDCRADGCRPHVDVDHADLVKAPTGRISRPLPERASPWGAGLGPRAGCLDTVLPLGRQRSRTRRCPGLDAEAHGRSWPCTNGGRRACRFFPSSSPIFIARDASLADLARTTSSHDSQAPSPIPVDPRR